MRRLLLILGVLTLVGLVAAGAVVGFVAYRGSALDAEAKAFVDSSVPAITAAWSTQKLLDRAAPEFLHQAGAKPGELDALFESLSRRLGPMTVYQGATGDALMSFTSGSGSSIRAAYVAKAKFEAGSATIRIRLVKLDGQWLITAFFVDANQSGVPSKAT